MEGGNVFEKLINASKKEDFDKLKNDFFTRSENHPYCSNCMMYGWCDRDLEPIKQFSCSQCGWMRYCSKVCQLEHWKKVHSKHCKFLAGKAVKQNSRHSQDTCPKCRVEIQIGSENIVKDDNPFYPCHLEQSFPGVSSAGYKLRKLEKGPIITGDLCIPLGEVTGQYVSKHEKNISILQQIIFKISAVYPVAVSQGDFYHEIFTSLVLLRLANWQASMQYPTEDKIDHQMSSKLPGFCFENEEVIMRKVVEIHNSMMKEEQQDGVFRWWSSFLLFLELRQDAQFFFRSIFELQKLSDQTFDKFSSKLNLKDVVRNNNFFHVWESLLTSVTYQMMPFSDLIKMLCDGQVDRKCEICAKDITITTFHPQFHFMQDALFCFLENVSLICKQFVEGKSFVILRPSKLYCCESKACAEEVNHRVLLTVCLMMTEGIALAQRFEEHRCDACFMVSDKGHRCSRCKTKVYCSPECKDKDWGVHRLCCAESVKDKENLKRKKKGDTEKRRELGVDRMNCSSFGASYDI